MAKIHGCDIPEDRFYWVEKHTWARLEIDGTVSIGITDVAQKLAKGIVNATPKDTGRTVQKGKSAGTLESGSQSPSLGITAGKIPQIQLGPRKTTGAGRVR